jgi:hypothetical protein
MGVVMSVKPNLKLLIAIRERGMSQKDFASVVNDHPTFVSRVVNGWVNLDDSRKLKYAMALGKKVENIFDK